MSRGRGMGGEDRWTELQKRTASLTGSLLPNGEQWMRDGDNVLIEGIHGLGKALPVDAPVATPTGFRPIGELAVGDPVLGRDGNTYRVEGVFPQGHKKVVEMHFSDGEIIECCDEHLWTFNAVQHRNKEGRSVTASAKVFAKTLYQSDNGSRHGQAKWYLPTVEAIEYPEQDLPISPYVLGLLLGSSSSCDSDLIKFVTADRQLVGLVQEELGAQLNTAQQLNDHGSEYHLDSIVDTAIPTLKQLGKEAWERSIPQEYKVAGKAQRTTLLRGLFADCLDHNGTCDYITASEQLALDIKEVVHSLGGVAKIDIKQPAYIHNSKKRSEIAYRLSIRFGSKNPFQTKNGVNGVAHQVHRRLVDIISTNRETEMVCIKVSSPDSLFLTSTYVPTHNTEVVMTLASKLGQKVKYYSCATLDPYTDLVGIPVPQKDAHGNVVDLAYAKPAELDDVDGIFFDELNRAHPKVQDAVLEIIQFGTINGQHLKNLKWCWGAINPLNEGYQVERLDHPLIDRFDFFPRLEPRVDVRYLEAMDIEPSIAQAFATWWDDQRTQMSKRMEAEGNEDPLSQYISPRRICKMAMQWSKYGNETTLKQMLPPGNLYDFGSLTKTLRAAEQLKNNPGKKLGESGGRFANAEVEEFTNDNPELAEFMKENPAALTVHLKVKEKLTAAKLNGAKLASDYTNVLEQMNPAILEGFLSAMAHAESNSAEGRRRSAFVKKWNELNKEKKMKDLYPRLYTQAVQVGMDLE